jgi:DNA-binding NarL/FixJ family response regulator
MVDEARNSVHDIETLRLLQALGSDDFGPAGQGRIHETDQILVIFHVQHSRHNPCLLFASTQTGQESSDSVVGMKSCLETQPRVRSKRSTDKDVEATMDISLGLATPLPPLRLLVVDDHGIVRDGITLLLGQEDDIQIIGHAATGAEAVLAAQRMKPDMIIMDLVLPDLSGVDVTKQILSQFPLMHIIVLSARGTAEHVYRAMRAGARGYVVKAAAGATLALAVRNVSAGSLYVTPGIIPVDVEELLNVSIPKTSFEKLSAREREVLRCIVAGSSSSDIAQRLALSSKTIDSYRSRLMVKLGVRNRSALIRFVIDNELIAL